jgi:hypothetical protein
VLHTIVIEVPDDVDADYVEHIITGRLQRASLHSGSRSYSPRVVEYHHEQMTAVETAGLPDSPTAAATGLRRRRHRPSGARAMTPTEMTTNAYNVQPGDLLLFSGSWVRVVDCGEESCGQRTWLTLAQKYGPEFDHSLDNFVVVTVAR